MAINIVKVLIIFIHFIFLILAWYLTYHWQEYPVDDPTFNINPEWIGFVNLLLITVCFLTGTSWYIIPRRISNPDYPLGSFAGFIMFRASLKIFYLLFLFGIVLYGLVYVTSAWKFQLFWLMFLLFFNNIGRNNTEKSLIFVLINVFNGICWCAWKITRMNSFAIFSYWVDTNFFTYYDISEIPINFVHFWIEHQRNNADEHLIQNNNQGMSNDSLLVRGMPNGSEIGANERPRLLGQVALDIRHSNDPFTFGSKPIEFEQTNCSICLQNYNIGDLCVELNCKHVFHYDCFERWNRLTNSNHNRCCVCNSV